MGVWVARVDAEVPALRENLPDPDFLTVAAALAAAVMAALEVVEVKAGAAAQADRWGKSLSSSTRWPLAAKSALVRWVDAVVMVGPAVLEVSEARAGQREKHVVFAEVPVVAAFKDSKDLKGPGGRQATRKRMATSL